MDFAQTLLASLSPHQQTRENATHAMAAAASTSMDHYILMLSRVLCGTQNVAPQTAIEVRRAAGIALKNALFSKDPMQRAALGKKWLETASQVTREEVHKNLLDALISIPGLQSQADSSKQWTVSCLSMMGTTIAQAISAVAHVELSEEKWPDLIGHLLQTATTSTDASSSMWASQCCALECIGFLCEEGDDKVLSNQSAALLTAIITGLSKKDKNIETVTVRCAAAKALLNAIDFIGGNFAVPAERDVVMQVVCEAAASTETPMVAVLALESLSRIFEKYYTCMGPYMSHGVAQLTLSIIASASQSSSLPEEIVLQAIEFWSVVCDYEGRIEPYDSQNFANLAIPTLLPVLLNVLPSSSSSSKNLEDDDDEDWNISMAAGACLSLLSETTGNSVLANGTLLNYVNSNISSNDWRKREAALMAFGSVMDGPDSEVVRPLITQGVPVLLSILRGDSSYAVRDTAAWCIGRVVDYFHDLIHEALCLQIVSCLCNGLADAPRVAINCSWSLMSFSVHFGESSSYSDESFVLDTKTNTMVPDISLDSECLINGPCCSQIVRNLFACAQRPEAIAQTSSKSSGGCTRLAAAAYQSLATVIENAPRGAYEDISGLLSACTAQLSDSSTPEDKQGHLCTIIKAIVDKLGTQGISPQCAAPILTAVAHNIFQKASTTTNTGQVEDALLLLGSVVSVLDPKTLVDILPTLLKVISPFISIDRYSGPESGPASTEVIKFCVGVYGDIARSLATDSSNCSSMIEPFVGGLMDPLFAILQRDYHNIKEGIISRSFDILRPYVLGSIGDIASAMGIAFVSSHYFDTTMQVLSHMSVILDLLLPIPKKLESDSQEITTDWDLVDARSFLVETCLEAYSAIIQGAANSPNERPSINSNIINIIAFIRNQVVADNNRSEKSVRISIGIIGDLCDNLTYGAEVRIHLRGQGSTFEEFQWLSSFLKDPLGEGVEYSAATTSVLNWTRSVISKP